MPRLKVCGVTDGDFASAAVRMGADYIGVIFAEGSPRRVDEKTAIAIGSAAKPAKVVGVFAGTNICDIVSISRRVPMDVVQLHGDYGAEAVSTLKRLGFEVWRLDGGEYAGEDATLLDGRAGDRRGGTGRLADWSRVAELKNGGRRVVLAGGISTDNIADAIATGADVIDVNSSLETAPGVKSIALLSKTAEAFSAAVRRAGG